MAPIKFEEDMKDKLEKRTINPSEKSWATLSQRLDNEEKNNNKKGFWWLGIAASIVGVLLVSNFFLNTENTNNQNSIIVEENTTNDTLKIEIPKQIIKTPKQEAIVKTEDITIKNSIKKANQKSIKTSNYIADITSIDTNSDSKVLVNKVQIKTPLIKNNSEKQDKTLAINTETKKAIITDNEINLLLAKATKDIAMQKTNSKTIPIDHNGLLLAVEDDLDETFRDKMLKMLKKGYKSVKESVAERND